MQNKHWAIINDNRLMEVAMYQETKGRTMPVLDGRGFCDRFSEFKRYIQRGSMTIEQLEERVYGRFGLFLEGQREVHPPSVDEFLNALRKIQRDEDVKEEKEEGNGKGKGEG